MKWQRLGETEIKIQALYFFFKTHRKKDGKEIYQNIYKIYLWVVCSCVIFRFLFLVFLCFFPKIAFKENDLLL